MLSTPTLMRLADMICGNDPFTYFRYRSSSYLTRFFIGIDLDYTHDGSTRNVWVQEVLSELNAKQPAAPGLTSREIIAVIEHLLHPDHFLFESRLDRTKAIDAVKTKNYNGSAVTPNHSLNRTYCGIQ